MAAKFLAAAHAALPANRDTTFQTIGMDGLPNATIVLPSGKILIGGNFQTIGGTSQHAFARLNSDGTLDTSFNPPVQTFGTYGKPVVTALVRQDDGKFIAAGQLSFSTTGSVARTNIIRFNEDGTVDPTFNANAISHYSGLALEMDGKVVLIGLSTSVKPMRLNADGSLDSSFNYVGGNANWALGLPVQAQADGHILAQAATSLLWLKSDGSLDATFRFPYPPNQLELGSRFAVAPDGSILVADFGANLLTHQVQRLSADGAADLGFTYVTQLDNQNPAPGPAAFLPGGGAVLVRIPASGAKPVSFFFLGANGKLTGQRDLPKPAINPATSSISVGAFAMQPDSKLLFATGFVDGVQNTFGMFRLMPPPASSLPVITGQPQSKSIGAGEILNLDVVATSASPLTYLWLHAGTNVPAQTTPSFSLNQNSLERAGDFQVIVGNSAGSVTSLVATVTVRAPIPLTMTQQPIGGSVKLAANFNLTAECSTDVTTGFQWYKNNVAVAFAGGQSIGSAFLSLPSTIANRAGDYVVVFTNAFGGSITSAVAHVEVVLPGPPVFTSQPQDQALFSTQPVQLSAAASADGSITYQWRHAGTNLTTSATIPSVTTPQLFVDGANLARFGEYAVIATLNSSVSTTSRLATVTLLPSSPPIFLSEPASLDAAFGQVTNLSVVFNGEAPLSLFLLHAGTNILFRGVPEQPYPTLNGPATNIYLLTALPTTAGDYSFVATNRFGGVTSAVATVTVALPPSATLARDLSNVVVGIGEFNFVALRQGLVATNLDASHTTHILAMNVASSLPPFGGGLPPFTTPILWQLAPGASNIFYVGENTGAAAATGSWGFAPAAPDYLALALTNFPRAGDISRLELFEDGRYGIILDGDNSKTQAGSYRVLGDRRPATNIFTLDLLGSNPVSVTWMKDGAPLNFITRAYQTTAKVIGALPSPTGVNTRYQLTIPDLLPSDAGIYSASISNLFPNPDHTFGQPAYVVTSVVSSKAAALSFRGFSETNAPAVMKALAFGGISPGSIAVQNDETTFVGAGTNLRYLDAQGQIIWGAGLPALVRAVISDGQGGAYVGGQDNDLGNFFLNRVKPSGHTLGGLPNATNLWTTTVQGPTMNYFQDQGIPHGAEVTGLLPSSDGVLVAGRFRGKSRFGAINVGLLSSGTGGISMTNAYDATFGSNDRSWDLFLARYDATGQLLWVHGYGGTNNETLTSFTADASGNLYLAGSFQGGAKFGPFSLESTKKSASGSQFLYATDGFIVKLDPNGSPIWAKDVGGLSQTSLSDTQILTVAPDRDGNVFFVAARTQAFSNLKPGIEVGSHFIARLNLQQEIVWAQTIVTGGVGSSILALDAVGNAVLLDAYSPFVRTVLGAANVDVPVGAGALLAKFTPGGTLLWARALEDGHNIQTVQAMFLSIDPIGEPVVAGLNSGRTTFDTFDLNATGLFIARLGADSVSGAPLQISFTPPAPGSDTFQLSWPSGFHLQRQTKLLPGTWETLDVTSPYTAKTSDFNQAFYRFADQP